MCVNHNAFKVETPAHLSPQDPRQVKFRQLAFGRRAVSRQQDRTLGYARSTGRRQANARMAHIDGEKRSRAGRLAEQ
jgi:hypothetical protein